MAAASVNASSAGENTSSDITVVAGTPITLGLRGTLGRDSQAVVQLKNSDGGYDRAGVLNMGNPSVVVDGPGVYRVVKGAAVTAFGVDQS